MTEAPTDLDNSVAWHSLGNGRLQIVLVTNGRVAGSLEFEPRMAAAIAGELLDVARIEHERSGRQLELGTDADDEWITIRPSTIGLGPCQSRDHEALIVRCGAASLGFEIPREELRALGEAMVTLSAGGARH